MSRRSRSPAPLAAKIYVGDLPRNADEREVEDAFRKFGGVRSVWVARNPPGFAFIEYEDPRDADDAVRRMDGSNLCGSRIRVEHSTGKTRPKPWMRDGGDRNGRGGDRGFGGRGGDRDGGGDRFRGGRGGRSRSRTPPPRRSPPVRRPRSLSRSRSR